jgi:hypothetical protein
LAIGVNKGSSHGDATVVLASRIARPQPCRKCYEAAIAVDGISHLSEIVLTSKGRSQPSAKSQNALPAIRTYKARKTIKYAPLCVEIVKVASLITPSVQFIYPTV